MTLDTSGRRSMLSGIGAAVAAFALGSRTARAQAPAGSFQPACEGGRAENGSSVNLDTPANVAYRLSSRDGAMVSGENALRPSARFVNVVSHRYCPMITIYRDVVRCAAYWWKTSLAFGNPAEFQEKARCALRVVDEFVREAQEGRQ